MVPHGRVQAQDRSERYGGTHVQSNIQIPNYISLCIWPVLTHHDQAKIHREDTSGYQILCDAEVSGLLAIACWLPRIEPEYMVRDSCKTSRWPGNHHFATAKYLFLGSPCCKETPSRADITQRWCIVEKRSNEWIKIPQTFSTHPFVVISRKHLFDSDQESPAGALLACEMILQVLGPWSGFDVCYTPVRTWSSRVGAASNKRESQVTSIRVVRPVHGNILNMISHDCNINQMRNLILSSSRARQDIPSNWSLSSAESPINTMNKIDRYSSCLIFTLFTSVLKPCNSWRQRVPPEIYRTRSYPNLSEEKQSRMIIPAKWAKMLTLARTDRCCVDLEGRICTSRLPTKHLPNQLDLNHSFESISRGRSRTRPSSNATVFSDV